MTDDTQPESAPVIPGSIPPLAPTTASAEPDDPEALPIVHGDNPDPPASENQHSFEDEEPAVDTGSTYHGADASS